MARYHMKPLAVEAEVYDQKHPIAGICFGIACAQRLPMPHLHTPAGAMPIAPGDYVVTDETGNRYPVARAAFLSIFEPVPPDPDPAPDPVPAGRAPRPGLRLV